MTDLLQRGFAADLFACLRFYSRLPAPGDPTELRLPQALRALPLAGAIIGGCGALTLLAARALGVPHLPAAVCAIAALVAVTGALHEDGFADLADGFGGGSTRERKLAIMRDSRIGAYGVCALALALMARVFALAALSERGLPPAMLALIVTAGVSRTAGLAPLAMLSPARADGAGAAVARPDFATLRSAGFAAALLSMTLIFCGASLLKILGGDLAAALAAIFVARLAARQIGGYTGDVLGAAQQAAEIAMLLALCAA